MGDPKVNKFFSGSGAKSPHVPWQNDAGSQHHFTNIRIQVTNKWSSPAQKTCFFYQKDFWFNRQEIRNWTTFWNTNKNMCTHQRYWLRRQKMMVAFAYSASIVWICFLSNANIWTDGVHIMIISNVLNIMIISYYVIHLIMIIQMLWTDG